MKKTEPRKSRLTRPIRLQDRVELSCDNGECYLESGVDVAGIQIKFNGQAEITPQLPEGWILQGNADKMLIFSLEGKVMKNQLLFTYEGIVKITGVIACNTNGERFNESFNTSPLTWGTSNWDVSIEGDKWENFKDKRKKGTVKKTSYNLPNYGLPKVEKTKIKKQKIRRRSTGGGY